MRHNNPKIPQYGWLIISMLIACALVMAMCGCSKKEVEPSKMCSIYRFDMFLNDTTYNGTFDMNVCRIGDEVTIYTPSGQLQFKGKSDTDTTMTLKSPDGIDAYGYNTDSTIDIRFWNIIYKGRKI